MFCPTGLPSSELTAAVVKVTAAFSKTDPTVLLRRQMEVRDLLPAVKALSITDVEVPHYLVGDDASPPPAPPDTALPRDVPCGLAGGRVAHLQLPRQSTIASSIGEGGFIAQQLFPFT